MKQGGKELRYDFGNGAIAMGMGGARGNARSPDGSAYGASLPSPMGSPAPTPQSPPAGTGQWGYGQGMIRPDVQRGPQQQWVFQNGSYYGPNGQQMSPENYARMQGSGSYGSSSSYSSTSPASEDAFQQAKAANEARYAEGKQLYDERYGRNMAYLEGAGESEKAAIAQRGAEAKAASGQRLQSLGLSGTTIGQTLNAGIDKDVGTQYGALQERLNQQKLAADAGMSKDKIDFIERRNDIYPEGGSSAYSSSGSFSGGPQGQFGYMPDGSPARSATDGMAYIPPRAGDPMGRGRFVPRDPAPRQPTGVNLDYITPEAMNDPAYMEALQNTPMRKPPRLLNQRQQGRG